jgi:predicted metalloprotease with PDZ domain
MKFAVSVLTLLFAVVSGASADDSGVSGPPGPAPPIPAPKDRAYPGLITLEVNAADLDHRVVRVHETLSGVAPGTVLLYPKWLPGTHAPEGPIDRLAGLQIRAGRQSVKWVRDPIDVYAFHVFPAPGVQSLDIEFEYLSPTTADIGPLEVSRTLLAIRWNDVVLYPAGYYSRQIPVEASLILPTGWQFASALESAGSSGDRTTFKRVRFDTLVDSPVYAGRFVSRLDLDPGSSVPVHLNLFANEPNLLVVKPEQLSAYRSLVQQAYRLFGSRHYDRYDFLFSLTDEIDHDGLEHHRSSENGSDPHTFTEWDKTPYDRDLLPHEYAHSWNGKFRRPADLWTANFNVPMQDSLLWVYEGQTQYWGQVLAARSGLRTLQQTLDEFAMVAAYYQAATGRQWRPLQDTTNDDIINRHRPQAWTDQQRFEDYYEVGQLMWLDADTLIRERSGGQHSLDDFARAFFGVNDGSFEPLTYTFSDVVKALNQVEPYDWAAFLHQRLNAIGELPPLDGLRRGGYRLVFTDTPSDYDKAVQEQLKRLTLFYSLGLQIDAGDQPGHIMQVIWDSPAFKAGLTRGAKILAVNGVAYDGDRLKDAIQMSHTIRAPIELLIQNGDLFSVVKLNYEGGLRYPHLERDPSQPPRLDEILKSRP